jgi:homoisocitrate dehydrogenase
MTYPTICFISGDGIGKEVIPASAQMLAALHLPYRVVWAQAGWETFQKTGSALPEETLALVKSSVATLFGATSSPTTGAVKGYHSPILEFRNQLGLYANLRPVQSMPVPASRPNIDMLIVRENMECLYIREERMRDADTAEAIRRITRAGSTRIGKLAAELASKRRGKLTIAHKTNVLNLTDGLFRQAVRTAALAAVPDLQVEERLVDALAHDMVLKPQQFDVIVAPNLYGDILSDLASALVGGLGIAPSANVGDGVGVYEPVHGSAPDIEGQGIANPTAAFLTLALLLNDLGHHAEAHHLQQAIRQCLQNGQNTRDLGGSLSTEQFTQAVLQQLA